MVPEELLTKILSGEGTAEEQKLFEQWLSEKKDNERLFKEYEAIWNNVDVQLDVDTESALSNLQGRLHVITMKKSSNIIKIFVAVASVAAILLLGLFLFREDQSTLRLTHNNLELAQILPDGTKIWLNKKAELFYPEVFEGKTRLVQLRGEAYFEVAKDANKPFIIQAGDATITVLGTAFNVRAVDDNVSIQVTEGKVSFSNKETHVKLSVGDEAIANSDGTIEKREFKNNNFLAWKTKEMYFANEPIGNVVNELSIYFNTPISITKEGFDTTHVTVHVQLQNIETALETIEMITDIKSHPSKGGYVFQ